MFEKITKKNFIEILTNNNSVLFGSVFRWTDEKVQKALNKDIITDLYFNAAIKNNLAEVREVKKCFSNHLLFSNGSNLYFDDEGKKEYFTFTNNNNALFIIKKNTYYDDFDGKNYENYIVYYICK